MSCLDEISNVIGDGMYLSMADKLKSIHNKLNGDRPFHEDSFYYSDDDSELGSDDDSDYSYPANGSPDGAVLQRNREIGVDIIRDHLLDYLQRMHQVWADMQKLDVDLKKLNPLITRMTAARKQQAIRRWCERSRGWRPLVVLEILLDVVPSSLGLSSGAGKPDGKWSSCDRDGNWNGGRD